MPRKKSSNEHYICDRCNTKFFKRSNMYNHVKKCSAAPADKPNRSVTWKEMLTCSYCKIVYGNRTNLARHIRKAHSDAGDTNKDVKEGTSSKGVVKNLPSPLRKCEVCKKIFASMRSFRVHRRKEHFNLLAKIPYCDQKKVNQVWFEKVLNCNNIVEIHKTAPNTLVMRRLDENTAIKVFETNTKVIDLSYLYPTKK